MAPLTLKNMSSSTLGEAAKGHDGGDDAQVQKEHCHNFGENTQFRGGYLEFYRVWHQGVVPMRPAEPQGGESTGRRGSEGAAMIETATSPTTGDEEVIMTCPQPCTLIVGVGQGGCSQC